jgi:DNA-binding NtrC family response regulator
MNAADRGQADVAIFCVCSTPELLNAVFAASEHAPQAFFAGEFRDYITVEKRPQFSQAIKEARACLVFVDFDRDPERALGTTQRLNHIFPGSISVVAVGSALDADLLLRAVRAGCTDFLTAPVSESDVSAAMQRFQQSSIVNPRHRKAWAGSSPSSAPRAAWGRPRSRSIWPIIWSPATVRRP